MQTLHNLNELPAKEVTPEDIGQTAFRYAYRDVVVNGGNRTARSLTAGVSRLCGGSFLKRVTNSAGFKAAKFLCL